MFNRTGYAWPDQILTVNGSVTNNGTIRNEGPNGLVLRVAGNISNNGTWTFRRTELTGTTTQTLAHASGKMFESPVKVIGSAGLIAGSDLKFSGSVDLNMVTLNMANFGITLVSSSAGVSNGTVNNAKDIVGVPVSGTYYPIFDNVTYDGSPNIKGRIQINSLVTLKGSVTITDTLENSSGYGHPEKTLKIIGNITNNGIIRNNGSYGLALNVTGNVTNNGSWVHNRTELSGTSNQILALATNKLFEAAFKVTDSLGMIVAGSNLAMTSWFDLRKCVLDMKNYMLTLQSSGATVTNGVVINTKDLVGKMVGDAYGTPILDNITYNGTINLRGFLRVNAATLQGNVTITDTVQNSSAYGHPEKFLKIVGNLTNNGLVRNGGSYGLAVDVTGNVTANKAFTHNRVLLAGIGNRTVVDKVSQINYLSTGEKVVLYGENYLPSLSIDSKSKCSLANGSNIYTANGTIDETLDNWSCITTTRKFTGVADYSFFKSRIKVLPNAAIDSVRIQSYGHQVPATFAGAVKCYWRLRTFAANPKQSFSSMTFLYNDDLLGTNTESALQVYQSQDSGMTWKQVSTTTNTTRDLNANSITLTDAFGYGDYVLSSSADPSSVRPSIIVSILGRNQIRIGGAPNRYTINYVNNSDSPTLDFLLPVMTEKFVHIKSVELPRFDGSKDIVPIDSIMYDGDDSSAVFWVAGMNPREARSFDIIVTSDAPPVNKIIGLGAPVLRKDSEILIEPLTTAAAAALTYIVYKAGTKIICSGIEYLGKKVEDASEQSPADKEKFKLIFPNTHQELLQQNKKENIAIEPLKKTGEKLSKILITKAMNITGGAYDIAVSTVKAVKGIVPNLRARLWVWIMDDVGYFGVKETTDVEISSKSLKKANPVRSMDPNEKVGPTGFGLKNYITSAGKMSYRILFENKKEATAPAWKVTIVDTLRPEFDPEMFEFGSTSHDSAQYTWKKTRTGNIVRWEIEGIELPPNVTPPQGEGWVSFSVNAKPNLASGTGIMNRAIIVFDMNNPIATNEFVNTLDYSAPRTTMKPIPTRMTASKLIVRWQGVDEQNGSGVESYTVYAAKDSGAFQPIGSTIADSMVVNLDMYTHKYSFYALAKDNVGNVETTRPSPVTSDITNGVGESENVIPTECALSQNFPNPFNPTTEITFSLSAKVRATLRIYDMLGREIATLLDDEKSPGKYTVKWDAGKNSSGVYFYRLIAGDASTGSARSFVQTRKLMLLK
ncbi:MAG: T9SS type A sorting domain-containing protein [Ignavibacteria bacterium]|nr:T9SS type A sorting domain-containing protein [Ignavibacteria bacterium]